MKLLLACLISLALIPASPAGASDIETQPVRFAKGEHVATLKGRIKGYQSTDHVLNADVGKTMHVRLETRHKAAYFNVLPPGSSGEAIFVGTTGGSEWTDKLLTSGEYKLRVYLMRSAARRNEVANYTLTVGVGDNPAIAGALGAERKGDVKVKGTLYHATGRLLCTIGHEARDPEQCDFGVIRGRAGAAEVRITHPGSAQRVLFFVGEQVSSDASVKASRQGDGWLIEVDGRERYQVPGAIINGG